MEIDKAGLLSKFEQIKPAEVDIAYKKGLIDEGEFTKLVTLSWVLKAALAFEERPDEVDSWEINDEELKALDTIVNKILVTSPSHSSPNS